MGRVRVYIAMSLDGFIAGPDDDLSWLPSTEQPTTGVSFGTFMADVGAMLMGRRTYDVISGFDGWFYGETPVLVATHRPLEPVVPTVRAASGTLPELIDEALATAAGRDVYIDGGGLIQQALRADRIDELLITVVPILLGAGIPLFDSLDAPMALSFQPPTPFGSMVQLRATRTAPASTTPSP